MANQWKKGDVVQLKSGGPKMTVAQVGTYTFGVTTPEDTVCVWFEGPKQQEHTFDEETLKKAD